MVESGPGDACGFTGSVSRRWTRTNPMAPVATAPPPSVTRSTVGGRRSTAPPQNRALGGDEGRGRTRPHPHRHVRGQGPGVGVVVEDDPGHDVDHEGDHARPERAVAQQLPAGAARSAGTPRPGPRPPPRGWRECERLSSSRSRHLARHATGSLHCATSCRRRRRGRRAPAAGDCWQGGDDGSDRCRRPSRHSSPMRSRRSPKNCGRRWRTWPSSSTTRARPVGSTACTKESR